MNRFGGIFAVCALFAVGCVSIEVIEQTDTAAWVEETEGDGGAGGEETEGGSDAVGGQPQGGFGEGGQGGEDPTCPPEDWTPTVKVSIALAPDTPASTIVVAGTDGWAVYSRYVITNLTDEEQLVVEADIVQVDPNGDDADFEFVALAYGGQWQVISNGSENGEFGPGHFSAVGIPSEDSAIPPKESRTFEIWGRTAPVLSSSAAGGEWHGVPRSGHSDILRLEQVSVSTDPWCVSQVSLETEDPNPMVLRKSKPTITKQPLASTTLANIDQDLFKFQVASDAAGAIAMKAIRFSWAKTGPVQFNQFRIRRGATDMAPSNYTVSVLDEAGDGDGEIVVSFTSEETIAGSGNVYTLHATASNAVSGSSMTTCLVPSIDAQVSGISRTGHVTTLLDGTTGLYVAGDGSYAPSILTSDLSETPHREISNDWVSDIFVVNSIECQQVAI